LRIKRRHLWIAILLGAPIAILAGLILVERNAEAKARAFCNQSLIGLSMEKIATAAKDVGEPEYRMIDDNMISVAFLGVTPFSRHVCVIAGKSGKVKNLSYRYID